MLAIWYWSIRRLVLEYLLADTVFEANYVFEANANKNKFSFVISLVYAIFANELTTQ